MTATVHDDYTRDDPTRARIILVVSGDLDEAQFSGIAGKSARDAQEFWFLVGDMKTAGPLQLATLLALLELDRHFKILYPGFLPPRPAGAFLFRDGMIRHGRGRSIAPWALREVQRLAQCLVEGHPTYMAKLVEAVRGKAAEVLTPIPDGFLLTDQDGLIGVAPPLPPLTPDLREAPLGVPQDFVIRADYVRDRYMRHLTKEQLGQRVADVFGNLHTIDDLGRVCSNNGDPSHPLWERLFSELLREAEIRYGPYPAGWKKGSGLLDHVEWPGSLTFHRKLPDPIPGSLRPKLAVPGPILVKYGKARHLEALLRSGSLLLMPASQYADKSLGPARKDDELGLALDIGSFGLGRVGGLPHSFVNRSGIRKRVTLRSGTDYYVSCFSRALSRRLLYDFDADCCLYVRDPDEFVRRIGMSVAGQLPGWSSLTSDVEYFDPLQVTEVEVKPFLWKHFRYAYQKEFRLAWFPPTALRTLDPVALEIGSLEDIAELVALG